MHLLSTSCNLSPTKHSRAWYLVRRRNRIVDVHREAAGNPCHVSFDHVHHARGNLRIARGDVARDRDLGRVGGPAAGDGDLCARDVPLRRAGDVQTDLLDADEVLCGMVSSVRTLVMKTIGTYVAVRDAFGQRGRQLRRVLVRELERVKRRAPLGNLEPLRAGAIPRCGRLPARHLAHCSRTFVSSRSSETVTRTYGKSRRGRRGTGCCRV